MKLKKEIKIKKMDEDLLDNLLLKYELLFDEKFSKKEKKEKLRNYFEKNDDQYKKFILNKKKLTVKYWNKKNKNEMIEIFKKNENYLIADNVAKKFLINLMMIYQFLNNEDDFSILSKKEYKKINKLLKYRTQFEKNIVRNNVYKNIFKKDFIKKLNEYIGRYEFGFQASKYEIDLKNVNKFFSYGNKIEHMLKNVNIQIPKEKLLIISGPSGSGKSTLINIISGLLTTESGDIVVSNHNLKYLDEKKRAKFREENISFVFQSYNLIPTLTARDNILLGSDLLKNKKQKIDIDEIAKNLNIHEQLGKYPNQLSGGQKQRVSIARSLVKNPRILIADEPTGALDKKAGKEVLKIFKEIIEKYKTTIILVTHNPEIKQIGDYILSIKNGRIESFVENKIIAEINDLKMEI